MNKSKARHRKLPNPNKLGKIGGYKHNPSVPN